jgi:hypothetical protein
MAHQNVSAQAAESNTPLKRFCEHCHGPLNNIEIRWRLRFLATMLSCLHTLEFVLGEDECNGLMYLLYDIADMMDQNA